MGSTLLALIWLVCAVTSMVMFMKDRGPRFTPILACIVLAPLALAAAVYGRQKKAAAAKWERNRMPGLDSSGPTADSGPSVS